MMSISLDLKLDKDTLTYFFDGVFGQDCSQADVFEEVKPFIQTAMDGENVCIFAFGQTGAGKTHTMEGPHSDFLVNDRMDIHELSGILPRTAVYILTEVQRLQKYIYDEIKIEISALEIYLDQVRDLFSD